ncbi:hypothetical protein BG011_000951, partial [Mortierella polycephala]
MTDNRLSLWCLVDGKPTSKAFSVKIASDDTVDGLKKLIKAESAVEFKDVDANDLTLWRVSITVVAEDKHIAILLNEIDSKTELVPTDDLSDIFEDNRPKKTIHILVQRPPLVHAPISARVSTPLSDHLSDESRPGAPLSGDLRVDIKKIADKFFATGSKHADFLDMSGCGKTRSVIELLCLQWGFYFNAAEKDLGSSDLSQLAEFLDAKTMEEQGPPQNTVFASNMTLVLFLSRILVLKYCLQIPDCRQTFSSASWAVLQVCPHMFQDVFAGLFSILYNRLEGLTIFELALRPIVRDEFLSVQETLATHAYPNFSSGTKLRLVVDEAQILGDNGSELFQSSFMETDPQPMLSPILNGFRKAGDQDLTIIYCGVGLSIQTLHWALGSGHGVKEEGSSTFLYLEFPGWTCRDSVQSYIDRLKEQLPNVESKATVDTLIPPAAVNMLYKRLRGRFRPIVTAIEEILRTGDPAKWEAIIDDIENIIVSWKEQERRGNLTGELLRLETKIDKHPKKFASFSSIKETLGLFLYRHCLLDATEIVLENEARLVEVAFGRIKIFGGTARTVLDEPFALKATFNYFREKDPSLVSAAERAMLHSDNPSVHGNMWEAMMPPVLVETFKSRPLSS